MEGAIIPANPSTYLLFLLRLAESILEQGISVSIFALDYRLAPEHPFPAQLQETTAAYSYLLNEMEILAEKLIVVGDSAGGHLALSFLVKLWKPHPEVLLNQNDKSLKQPGGVVLLSPWLSLHLNQPPLSPMHMQM